MDAEKAEKARLKMPAKLLDTDGHGRSGYGVL